MTTATTPILKAPLDMLPKTATVTLNLKGRTDWAGGTVSIEGGGSVPEITLLNNTVHLPDAVAAH